MNFKNHSFVKPNLHRGSSIDTKSSSSSIESPDSTKFYVKKLNSGPASLQEMIAEREWDRLIKVLKVKPVFAKKKVIVPSFLNEWKGQAIVYPIHLACASPTVPLIVLGALLNAYPKGLHKKESIMTRNCLHIALRAGASEKVISYLIERCPTLACERDSQGRIPLHYACSSSCSVATIRELVSICPRSICAPDSRGWTSLHVAVSKLVNPEIPRFLVSVCPEAVTLETKAGSTPGKILSCCPTKNSTIYLLILQEIERDFLSCPSFENFYRKSIKTTPMQYSYV